MVRRFARLVLVLVGALALSPGDLAAQGFSFGGFGGGGFGGFGGGGGFGRGGGFGGFGRGGGGGGGYGRGGGMRGGPFGGGSEGRGMGGRGMEGRGMGGRGMEGRGTGGRGMEGRGYPGRDTGGRGRYATEGRPHPGEGRPHPGKPSYPPRPRPEHPYPVVKHPYPRPPVVVHYPPPRIVRPVRILPPVLPPDLPHLPPRQAAGPPAAPPPPPPVAAPRAAVPPPPRRLAGPPAAREPFVPNEVLVTMRAQASPAQIQALEQRLGLVPIAVSRIGLLDTDLRRYRVPQNAGVPGTVQALRGDPAVRSVQPNFIFETAGDVRYANPPQAEPPQAEPPQAEPPQVEPQRANLTPPGSGPSLAPPGVPSSEPERPIQYALEALRLNDAHRVSTGADVKIAIIDTGMDETHPEIAGKVIDRFDAVDGTFAPHAHGTAMAGVIVADKGLMGIAPKARLIAIRAFSGKATGAQGTSNDIVRAVDYAVAHRAQILNLSFAGPRDELLGEVLAAAREKGVIEVAAAGNAGPDSPPLYPAAEPGVIAITATDNHNTLFAKANRGTYVAAAAPGVDILVPSPGGAMQLTSGTSVAAAEASGVIALLLQTYPRMGATVARRVLSNTAVPSGSDGTVLIDALAAVQTVPR